MHEAVMHAKMNGLSEECVDQINQVRLHEKLLLPIELVGASGKLRTEAFDKINKASQIRWKFEFPEVASPGAKLKKAWE